MASSPHRGLRPLDQVGATLGMLAAGEALADRRDPAADPIARLDDRDRRAGRLEVARRGKPGESCAENDDLRAREFATPMFEAYTEVT